jgi:hypothetical protein
MSQQHIPQPNSQSAAPAEVFDSTADAPHGQTVSALGTPGPRPGEVVVHTGQKNTLDFSIDRQFIPIDTFIWSTTQPRGTLLWSSPVHPQRVNPLVAYIAEIYNTWGGGIEFNFKVAGTGFHAGALAFVRIPPNVNPTQFSSPTEWGAFEYVVMDPKTLEVLSIDVMDQRQLNFHFMKMDETDPQSFGGYIACYVLIPLNTSSTGTQQIAIQAFARPGATFTMNQIIMPGVKDNEPPEPSQLILLYNQYFRNLGQQTSTTIRFAMTTGKEVQKWYNCFIRNFSGEWNGMASLLYHSDAFPSVQYRVSQEVSTTEFNAVQAYNSSLAVPGERFAIWSLVDGKGGVAGTQNFNIVKDQLENGTPTLRTKFTITTLSGVPKAGDNYYVSATSYTSPTNFEGFAATDMFTIPVAGEQFFFFTNSLYTLREVMPRSVGQAIIDKLITGIISPTEVIFMDCVDIATNLNLFTCKLYHEGFITVSDRVPITKITQKFKFVFNSYALRTSIIPTTPSQMVNALLMSNSLRNSSLESFE